MKKSILKRIMVLYALLKIDFISFLRSHNKQSKNIIIVDGFLKDLYYGNLEMIYNLSYINAFLKLKKDFKICTSSDALNLTEKNIYLNFNKNYLKKTLSENYSKRQVKFILELEGNNNKVFPSSTEALYWENKIYMYFQFEKKQINFPKTILVREHKDILKVEKELSFPVISKIDNGSGSKGIIEIKSDKELRLLSEFKFPYLIQNRLNISKDCRIVILNFKYHHHYFRNNTATNWHPTSTSMGSYLSYEQLPEKIIEEIEHKTKNLNLRIAAYDICWENDDLSSPIVFLEVSPGYLPNPKYFGKKKYKDWKTDFFGKNPYWKSNIDNIFSQKIDLFKEVL